MMMRREYLQKGPKLIKTIEISNSVLSVTPSSQVKTFKKSICKQLFSILSENYSSRISNLGQYLSSCPDDADCSVVDIEKPVTPKLPLGLLNKVSVGRRSLAQNKTHRKIRTVVSQSSQHHNLAL